MSRDLAVDQEALARASHIAPIPLVKLITYTDLTADTIDEIFYLSTLPVVYDYGASGTDRYFWPVIVGGGDFFSGMVHSPQPNDQTGFGKTFKLQCTNTAIGTTGGLVRFSEILQTHNLEGARIEISQLYIPRMLALPIDLTGETGLTHTVFISGRVNRVAPITDSHLTIECVEDLPSMAGNWNYATDPTKTDPLDLGKRLPRIYGKALRQPCLNYDVGSEFTFAEPITAGRTGSVKISDGSGLPSGSFSLRVDGEKMTCSGATAKTLDIDARGVSPTSAAEHSAGALAVELIATATYIVSDRECDAVNELYVINPLNGKLLRLNSTDTPWVTTLADTVAEFPGETLTTVKFDAAALTTLIEYFEAQTASGEAAVDVQPIHSNPAVEVVQVPLSSVAGGVYEPVSLSGPWKGDVWVRETGYPKTQIEINTGAGAEGLLVWCPISSLSGRQVSRYRVSFLIDADANSGATTYARCSFDFYGTNGSMSRTMTGGAAFQWGVRLTSGWINPSGTPSIQSIERSSAPTSSGDQNFACIFLDATAAGSSNGGINIFLEGSYVEVELVSAGIARDTDVAVSGGGGVSAGFGLRFFADVDGVPAPAAVPTYELAEDFEAGSWGARDCAAALTAAEAYTGTKSLAVTWDADAEAGSVLFPTGTVAGWSRDASEISLQSGEGHRPGASNVVEVKAQNAVQDALAFWYHVYYALIYGFESGSWNDLTCAAVVGATNPRTGTNALEITVDVDTEAGSEIIPTDDLTNWAVYNDATLALVSGEGHRGSGSDCIEATYTGGGDGSIGISFKDAALSHDFTDDEYNGGRPLLVYDVKVKKGGQTWGDMFTGWGNQNGQYSYTHHDAEHLVEDTWYTMVLRWDESVQSDFVDTPDMSDVDYLRFSFGAIGMTTSSKIYIANIKMIYQDCIVQKNDLASVDFSAASNLYRAHSYHDCPPVVGPQVSSHGNPVPHAQNNREIKAWISSNAWSGTAIGSAWRRCYFDVPETNDQYLATDQDSYTDDGGPTISDIDSMRLSVRISPGRYVRDPVFIHYVDDYEGNDAQSEANGDMSEDLYETNRALIMFDFKIKKAGTSGYVEFRIGTDPDNYWELVGYYEVDYFAENTWYTCIHSLINSTPVGSPTDSNIDYFGVVFNKADRSANCKVYFDNIKLVPQDVIAQNNDAGAVDLSSFDDLYQIWYKQTFSMSDEDHLWLWLSSDVWSGTAIGSNYRRIELNASAQTTWKKFPQIGSVYDDGSPDMENIRSIRFAVRNETGRFPRDPTIVHYIDTLEINNPPNTYQADYGDVLVHPADIWLHFLQEEFGEILYSGTIAALVTALGAAAEWGFDLRSVGFSFEEIAARMAFESRVNLIAVQGAAVVGHTPQRQWKLLSAGADYGFGAPAASAVISQTHEMTDQGRAVDHIASYFSVRYGFDATLQRAGSEESFKSALIANPATSDVPILAADIADAAERFGAREAPLIAFRCIQDTNTAKDIAGYIVQERMANDRRVFELREVAWFEAMLYDVGDRVWITPPWSTATLCRIVGMAKKFTENTWTIGAVEVPEIGLHT